MGGKLESLKYAIFDEWTYNPPAGSCTWYYSAHGETYDALMGPASDVYDHVSDCVYDEELDDLRETYDALHASKDSISSFYWDNGECGCGCELLAEGAEIVEKLARFIDENTDAFVDDECFEYDEEEEEEEEEGDELPLPKELTEAVENAKAKPDDFEAVMALIQTLDEQLEKHNDRICF